MALAILVPCRVTELACDCDFLALREIVRQGFGTLAEDGAVDEVAPFVPLAGLPVSNRGIERQGERQELRTTAGGRSAKRC